MACDRVKSAPNGRRRLVRAILQRNSARRAVSSAVFAGLLSAFAVLAVSCASLPTKETTAFNTVASASNVSFANLSTVEADALKSDQLAAVADGQKKLMLSDSCVANTSSSEPCVIIIGELAARSASQGLALVSRTKRVQKLISGIADYGAAMSDLAAAKDLQAADDAAARAATSLKTLVSAVDPPVAAVAGPVIDALVFANNQLQVAKRRKLMLTLAIAGQPVIDGAVEVMAREAVQLRATLIDLREKRLMALKQGYDDDQQRRTLDGASRAALIQQIVLAAGDLSDARAIETDFTPLSKCHAGVVAALKNPKADVNESVQQAQAFLKVLQSLAAIKPTPAHKG